MQKPSAVVIPYFLDETEVLHVFLQMRDNNAREDKNVFSFFGGQMKESEDPLIAATRELSEEFSHPPTIAEKLGIFKNFPGDDMHVFLAPVSESFGTETKVLEGQYGQFLTLDQVQSRTDVSHIVLPPVAALVPFLKTRE
jgi:8-oxo-dGTP pyrophosphatase MutT (NUDIX family)